MKKISSLSLPAAVTALLIAALFAVTTAAQAPQSSPPGGSAPPPPPHVAPKPTNLKVLPKDMTGDQVHDLMHKWEADLGTECSHCHTPDPNNLAPNGKPRLNFADDSKKEKSTARLMYKMVEDINTSYVSMVENSGEPVTCGTCHRGHPSPEPFVAPPEHDHDHEHEHHEGAPEGQKPPIPH